MNQVSVFHLLVFQTALLFQMLTSRSDMQTPLSLIYPVTFHRLQLRVHLTLQPRHLTED